MNTKGFTLVELLVVVLIIGVLSAIALPQYTASIERARATEALTMMNDIRYAAERYRFQHDEWPRNNTWTDLDVNIPTIPGSTDRGGKNFKVTMTRSGDKFVVLSERTLPAGGGKYYLKTVLTDNTDSDTITAVRCCTTNSGGTSCGAPSGEKAMKFCNAITGAHNSDF